MAEDVERVQVEVDGAAVDAGIDEFIEADLEAEVQPKLKIPTPEAPTASELAEHRDGGHLQYRSWCEDCVEAFGREDQHVARDRVHGACC